MSFGHLVIASYGDHIMVIYCPCRECWGNFSIRCSLATQSNSGSLVIAFCIFLFSSDQTYFGGERSNMLVLHLPTNRPWRRSWETKVRTEGLWWLLQSREKDVTEHQILLSVMWGCNRLDFLFFEKIRGPTAASRGEILATPGRGDPVVHSLTGSSRLSFALSLWPQRLCCTAVLLFYCSTVLLFCNCSTVLHCSVSNFPPTPTHCRLQWPAAVRELRLFPPFLDKIRSRHISHIIFLSWWINVKRVIEGGFNSPLF